ncbi:hypothetical protein N9I89_03135 [Porticoccaceae bacterium]|jgi:hypothetical protein|nr:hypothetical protein [Porticoccaceae bacterium]
MSTKLKTLLMAMILAGFSAQHAVAENLNNEDMAFAFDDSAISTTDSAQMDFLTTWEMKNVEGAWFPYRSLIPVVYMKPIEPILSRVYIFYPNQSPINVFKW